MAGTTFEQFRDAYQAKLAETQPPPTPAPTPTTGAPLPETMTPEQAAEVMKTPGGYFNQALGGPVQDYFKSFMAQALPGHPLNNFLPDMAVPDTLTGAAVTAGTLAAPEAKAAQYFGSAARNASKFAPMLDRLLAPMGAGAVGGFAEKGEVGDALKGIGIGLITGVPAEAASGISRWFAGSKLAQRFLKEDPEAMKGLIQRLVPEFGKTIDEENIGRAFWQGSAQDKLSALYDRRMTAIADAAQAKAPGFGTMGTAEGMAPIQPTMLPDGTINSPRIAELKQMGVLPKKEMDVQETMQAIRDLRLKGRSSGTDPGVAATLNQRQAKDYASEVSADLKEVLDGIDPRLGKSYVQTDRKYAKGAEMIRYLKQPDIVDDNGTLNMGLLQRQLKEEEAYGLSHIFTPNEFKDVMDTVFRGGPDTVVDNILKSPTTDPHLRMHASESGRVSLAGNLLSMLRNNKYAGNYEVDFLKPKGPQLLMQRLGAGKFGDLSKPIGSQANTLKAEEE